MMETNNLFNAIDKTRLPKHIAIIMDGNGRWAQQRGEQRVFGHNNGVQAVREATESAAELGIKYLTLYAFSTENWNRPKDEVDALMHLLIVSINKEINTLNDNSIRLRIIGDIHCLAPMIRTELEEAMAKTANNNRMDLFIALSYSGRWEIVDAMKKIANQVKEGKLDPGQINEELVSASMNAPDLPDPELLIRTSGEFRTSNFLMWQTAYTELFFSSKLWPDFRKDDLYEAIIDFQHRERRFGKTSEQIIKCKG